MSMMYGRCCRVRPMWRPQRKALTASVRFLALAAAVGLVAPGAATKARGSPATASSGEELKVLSAVGLRQVMVALTPAFEREIGHKLAVTFDGGAVIALIRSKGMEPGRPLSGPGGLDRYPPAGSRRGRRAGSVVPARTRRPARRPRALPRSRS